MNIGEAARRSGVSTKMIRYYEQSGLVPPPARLASGYRDYADNDVHRLRFVRHARDLGFDAGQIGELLSLWSDRRRASADVHALTLLHIARLRDKAAEIERMIAVLQRLADDCHHDTGPDCPILDELAEGVPAMGVSTHRAAGFGETRRKATGTP
ncbi:MAG: Cu(I)-responsive transcriptional regulator [Pseudomonas sp.]